MKLRQGLLGIVIVLGLNGCVVESHVPPGYSVPAPYPLYDYYYYPSVNVYFHIPSGVYYYYTRGKWIQTTVLPPEIRLTPRDRHPLRIESEKPYLQHPEHQQMYRPQPNYRPEQEPDRQERDLNRKLYEQYDREKEERRRH